MKKYSFHDIKIKIEELTATGCEPELEFHILGKKYMIIGYEKYVSFQRCGVKNGSGEFDFANLDELYNKESVDNILLSRDWHSIEDFYCPDFD